MTISRTVKPVSEFAHGFLTHLHSARFILDHPGLLRLVAIPFLINLLVFSGMVYLGMDFFNDSVVHLIPQGDAWYRAVLYYFLWTLAVLVTAIVVFFSFTAIGNLVSAPFNDLLSEKTEGILTGRRDDKPFSLRAFGQDALRALAVEIRKILLFVGAMLVLLLLNLIPVAGSLLYSVLAVGLTLFFLAAEYMGFVFSRKRMNFSAQRHYIFSRKMTMLGFSVGALALLAIPFVQFACIPLAVVGATRLWCENPEPTKQARDSVLS